MSIGLSISLVALFAGFAAIAVAVSVLLLDRATPEQKRLRVVTAGAGGPPLIFEQTALTDTPDPKLARLSKALPRSPKDMSRIRKQLAGAGLFDFRFVLAYAFAELALPCVFAAAVISLMGLRRGWVLAVIAAVMGYLLPGLWLQRRTTLRRKAIQNGLPDALDLFIVCMEAGSSLDQAISKASDELDITHPALTQELRFITTEIRAGKPRLEAFKNFAKRTGVDDVRSLVAMLVQTDRFGTSVAQALRTHAANSRTKRRQLAEERAGKIGVKLVFPLALCMFPAVYVVCIGPVVIAIYRTIMKT